MSDTSQGFHLPSHLRTILALDPSAPALQFEDRWFTWGELAQAADRIDALLDAAGLGAGSQIGAVLPNRPEAVATFLAIIGSGRTLVSLSPIQSGDALAADVEALRVPAIVAGPDTWAIPQLRTAVGAIGGIGLSVEVGPDGGVELVDGLTALGPGPFRTPDPDAAILMLTSGTTGPAKRVRLRYASLEASLSSVGHYQRSGSALAPRLKSTTVIQWSPLVHISGTWSVLSAISEGRKISLMSRFNVDEWVARLREHQPRTASLPPTAMRMVLDANPPKDALASLKTVRSGTAPLDPDVKRQFELTYGVPVLIVYGATEFAGAVAGWTLRDYKEHDRDKAGSVGRAHPGIELRVVDPDSGDVLPAGVPGALEAKGPQLPTPDWVRTTDLARIDEDGFLWLEGRADDVIIRGGFKVPTAAVAAELRRHPAVLDAAVIGLPDQRLGAVPVAAVELRAEGGPVTPEELTGMLHDRLPPYQVPIDILIVDALPRTESMKVSQPGVAALFKGR